MNKIAYSIFLPLVAGFLGAFLFQYLSPEQQVESVRVPSNQENYLTKQTYSPNLEIPDLVEASKLSTPSVVFIKTVSGEEATTWMDLFFYGYGSGRRISSGSGVIYSEDGYIITNNHVINDADEIEVISNKRTYKAEVVGIDPNTDLALLKIDAKNLPAIAVGNSRELQVGEWVLAVGNPFNLNSTVTAGIVSAKGRKLGLVKSNFPLESFIQTDAAINPGNSGGALVNLKGELVGINTAILSQTGSYAGYGFAVPSNVVQKVVEDLKEYNQVQKAFLGADYEDLDESTADYLGLETLNGAVVGYVSPDGAADKAGLKKGDVIIKVNNRPIEDKASLNEELNYYRPGDKISVVYLRENEAYSTMLTLNNAEGKPEIIKRQRFNSAALGAIFERVPKVEKERLRIENGVRLVQVRSGLFRKLNIPEGFVIIAINRKIVDTPEEVERILTKSRGRIILEGIRQNGEKALYTFYI